MALQAAVNEISQIVARLKKPGRLSTIRNKAQQRPIGQQQHHAAGQLPAPVPAHQHQRTHQIPAGYRLQCIAEQVHARRVSTAQIPLHHHSQDKKQNHAPQHPPPGSPTGLLSVSGKRHRHGTPGNKQEQRHDQVPAGKSTAPLRMHKLSAQPRRHIIPPYQAAQLPQYGRTTG